MEVDRSTQYRTRDDIMNLLSPDEIGFVSAAEEEQIPEGDEYIDLSTPSSACKRLADTDSANALPHTAVSDETWGRILDVLETPIEQA